MQQCQLDFYDDQYGWFVLSKSMLNVYFYDLQIIHRMHCVNVSQHEKKHTHDRS